MRYAFVCRVLCSYTQAAVEAIRRNIEFNKLDTQKLIPNKGDAAYVHLLVSSIRAQTRRAVSVVMCQHKDPATQFDVVDLDPYGTASPFLDGAVQAVKV